MQKNTNQNLNLNHEGTDYLSPRIEYLRDINRIQLLSSLSLIFSEEEYDLEDIEDYGEL